MSQWRAFCASREAHVRESVCGHCLLPTTWLESADVQRRGGRDKVFKECRGSAVLGARVLQWVEETTVTPAGVVLIEVVKKVVLMVMRVYACAGCQALYTRALHEEEARYTHESAQPLTLAGAITNAPAWLSALLSTAQPTVPTVPTDARTYDTTTKCTHGMIKDFCAVCNRMKPLAQRVPTTPTRRTASRRIAIIDVSDMVNAMPKAQRPDADSDDSHTPAPVVITDVLSWMAVPTSVTR